jgi:hypothetical protein
MTTDETAYRTRADVGAKALEAVRLGSALNTDHRADAGALRSIGNCRLCGILSYQANDGTWKHVPAIEECDEAETWIRQHQLLTAAPIGDAAGIHYP